MNLYLAKANIILEVLHTACLMRNLSKNDMPPESNLRIETCSDHYFLFKLNWMKQNENFKFCFNNSLSFDIWMKQNGNWKDTWIVARIHHQHNKCFIIFALYLFFQWLVECAKLNLKILPHQTVSLPQMSISSWKRIMSKTVQNPYNTEIRTTSIYCKWSLIHCVPHIY